MGGCEPSQIGTTRLATRPIQQSDPERTGQITPLAPAKLPRYAFLDSFVHKIVTVIEKFMKLLMKLSNYPTNFATLSEFAYTPNSTCYTIFKRKSKLPFLVEIHVLLIFSKITRGRILIFCHGLLLVMTNDQRPQPFHSLLSDIAQVGAAT